MNVSEIYEVLVDIQEKMINTDLLNFFLLQ